MNLPLNIKLPLYFSTMVAIAAAAVGLISFLTVNESLLNKAYNELAAEGVRSSVRIKESLELDHRMAITLAYDSELQTLFEDFSQAFEATVQNGGDAADFSATPEFMAIKNANFAYISGVKRALSFSSYYLVNLDGTVVFAEDPSSAQKNNIGANLLSGEFENTEVAQVLQAVLPSRDGTASSAEFAETPYITSDLTPDPIKTFYALPLKNRAGTQIGAILFAKNGNDASRAMIKDLNGTTSDRFLLNADGALLLGTKPRARAETILASFANLDEEVLSAVIEDTQEIAGAIVDFSVGDQSYKLLTVADTSAIRSESNHLGLLLLIDTLVITALAIAISIFVTRRNIAPIREMRGHFHRIADTLDLSYRVNSKKRDEVGSAVRALDRIMIVFEQAFGRIGEESKTVEAVISSLGESVQSLAYNAEVQSTAIDELSSSVEETSSQVRSNAQSAQRAYDSAARMNTTVFNGKARMDEMVDAMNDIRVSSVEISRIIKVIDDIAFQTNLLALNAAVEAARAGSQGRGFAVVASEVRNLAARSTVAARETQELIEQASNRVSVGVEISSTTKAAFDQIANDIEYVSSLMADISRASEEQAHGVESVNLAINEIARYASNSTAEAEKIANTSEKLIRANEELRKEIGRFGTVSQSSDLITIEATTLENGQSAGEVAPKVAA